MSIACAGGHPPPILVPAEGEARVLPVSGRLLGVWDDLALEQVDLPLEPGDTLLLYSDGVTDQGARHTCSPAQLAAQLPAATSATQLADAAEAFALGSMRAQRDDIALVSLRYAPPRGRRDPGC